MYIAPDPALPRSLERLALQRLRLGRPYPDREEHGDDLLVLLRFDLRTGLLDD